MLNKNATCRVEPLIGYSAHGEPQLGPSVPEDCAVIRLRRQLAKTTVRADSSSSRGHGDERLSDSKLLLDGSTSAEMGSRVTVNGVKLRVVSMWERLDVSGYVDHYEVECELWE